MSIKSLEVLKILASCSSSYVMPTQRFWHYAEHGLSCKFEPTNNRFLLIGSYGIIQKRTYRSLDEARNILSEPLYGVFIEPETLRENSL